MPDDVRARPLDINPSVPHHLICEVAIFGQAHRIYFAASSIILSSAMMCVRVGKDDVDAARVHAHAGAGPLAPIVIPAYDIFDRVRVLITVIDAGSLALIQRPGAVFVERRRVFVPIFPQPFVTRIFHRPHRYVCTLVDVEHFAAILSDSAVEHLARS